MNENKDNRDVFHSAEEQAGVASRYSDSAQCSSPTCTLACADPAFPMRGSLFAPPCFVLVAAQPASWWIGLPAVAAVISPRLPPGTPSATLEGDILTVHVLNRHADIETE